MSESVKKIAVIGTGAWGTALAIHAANAGLQVSLLGRREEIVERLAATRRHPALPGAPPIPDGVRPTLDPSDA
ncbi:MAG: 3-hydroxyacyl-CoA dehydrogenase NAD-binding domain-containing protein, partial [Thermoanaerobaculia bacterium]